MKKFILAASLSIASSLAMAQGIPNTFVAGQPARAADVNQNFSALLILINGNSRDILANTAAASGLRTDVDDNTSAIATNASDIAALQLSERTTLDYRDYSLPTNITQKTFDVIAPPEGSLIVRAVRDYTHGNDNGVPTLISRETRYDNDNLQVGSATERRSRSEANFNLFTGNSSYDAITGNLLNENIYVGGLKRRSTTMRSGDVFMNAVIRQNTRYDFDGNLIAMTETVTTAHYHIGQLEDVTVPYNGGTTYQNCLVSYTTFNTLTDNGSRSHIPTTFWLCPGIGLVKRSSTLGIYLLSDVVMN